MPLIWQSYVSYHVVCDLVLHPHADPVSREQRFEAVALFADVSGFTAISEARFVYFRLPRSTSKRCAALAASCGSVWR